MRFVAPLARPVFTWNHNKVMGWGFENKDEENANARSIATTTQTLKEVFGI
jgi:hypothetical protein